VFISIFQEAESSPMNSEFEFVFRLEPGLVSLEAILQDKRQ